MRISVRWNKRLKLFYAMKGIFSPKPTVMKCCFFPININLIKLMEFLCVLLTVKTHDVIIMQLDKRLFTIIRKHTEVFTSNVISNILMNVCKREV